MRCAAMPGGTASSRALAASPRSKAFAAKSERSIGRSCASSWIRNTSTIGRCGWTSGFCWRPFAPWFGTAMLIERRDFLGFGFDPLSTDQALARLSNVTAETPYGYVVTPNVDHIVRLHENEETERQLRTVYGNANMCLCDSKVLRLLARFRGVDLPVIPGSELTELVL